MGEGEGREVCSFGAGQQEILILSPQPQPLIPSANSANPISGGAKTISKPLALGCAAVAGQLRRGPKWGSSTFHLQTSQA